MINVYTMPLQYGRGRGRRLVVTGVENARPALPSLAPGAPHQHAPLRLIISVALLGALRLRGRVLLYLYINLVPCDKRSMHTHPI